MRRAAIVLASVVIAACGTKPAPAPPPPPPPPPPAPAPINMADVAGKWTVQVMPETGDSVLLTYTVDAKADTAGWMVTLPKRKPMPVHVTVSGDSVMTDMADYQSVLRPGTTVSTHGVFRLVGGKMVGTTIAHYKSTKPDSVRTLRISGTRAP